MRLKFQIVSFGARLNRGYLWWYASDSTILMNDDCWRWWRWRDFYTLQILFSIFIITRQYLYESNASRHCWKKQDTEQENETEHFPDIISMYCSEWRRTNFIFIEHIFFDSLLSINKYSGWTYTRISFEAAYTQSGEWIRCMCIYYNGIFSLSSLIFKAILILSNTFSTGMYSLCINNALNWLRNT